MESLQITDKFCLNPLISFLNMAYVLDISNMEMDLSSSLHFLSPRLSYALSVHLTFIAQYSNILHPS